MEEDTEEIMQDPADVCSEESKFAAETLDSTSDEDACQCNCQIDKCCAYVWGFIFNIVSIVTYVMDVGSDVSLAIRYYLGAHWRWFALTIAFVILPTVMMICCNIIWYIERNKNKRKKYSSKPQEDTESERLTWIIRATSVLLHLAPILRYANASAVLVKMWKSKNKTKKKKFEEDVQKEEIDSSILRLFECFLEAIPQLCLQIFIMCSQRANSQEQNIDGVQLSNSTVILQYISMLTSLLSVLWALCAYHWKRNPNKTKTAFGTVLQVLWHLLILTSRIVAISVSATYFQEHIFIIILIHWFLMLLWILASDSNVCESSCKEVLFDIISSWGYIFYFFNIERGRSPWRYLVYYSIAYVENAALTITWYHYTQTTNIWYHTQILIFVFAGFFLGIVCQAIYYVYFYENDTVVDIMRERFKGNISSNPELGTRSNTIRSETIPMEDIDNQR